MKRLSAVLILCVLFGGCATVDRTGMTKNQVLDEWGTPNAIKTSKNSYFKKKNQEVWHYFGKGLHIKNPGRSVVFEDEVVRFVFLR